MPDAIKQFHKPLNCITSRQDEWTHVPFYKSRKRWRKRSTDTRGRTGRDRCRLDREIQRSIPPSQDMWHSGTYRCKTRGDRGWRKARCKRASRKVVGYEARPRRWTWTGPNSGAYWKWIQESDLKVSSGQAASRFKENGRYIVFCPSDGWREKNVRSKQVKETSQSNPRHRALFLDARDRPWTQRS